MSHIQHMDTCTSIGAPMFPNRVLYTFSVVLVTLFVMAFLWLVLVSAVNPLRLAIVSSMAS